ncbi:MAG TPA: hypothetical protein PLV92_00750, partial [Pirellulaceae bacterium]|nr:hypothetical protein [Pirellulaceae bacterium]
KPGFYRVGLTVDNGRLSNLAWRDFYVVEKVDEWGTEAAGDAAAWSWFDPRSSVTYSLDEQIRISGRQSLKAVVSPYSGGRVNLLYPATKSAAVPLAGKKRLVFWLKAINENVPAWQDVNPVVTLHESDERALRLTPKGDLLSQPPYNEAREGWTYFSVPLAGDETWQRGGDEITRCNWLSLGFDSWGAPPLRIWLDGLAIVGD